MAGKSTDRKGKYKEAKFAASDLSDNLAAFTLPDSLPCSEVDFPVLVRKKHRANWKDILAESEKKFQEIEAFNESKTLPVPKAPFLESECDYIKNEVFVHLIPALEEALNKAKIWEALQRQKCFFNGIDHIVQYLLTILWPNGKPIPAPKLRDLQSIRHLIPADAYQFYDTLTGSPDMSDDVDGFNTNLDFEIGEDEETEN